jgi:hypothetical protein
MLLLKINLAQPCKKIKTPHKTKIIVKSELSYTGIKLYLALRETNKDRAKNTSSE